MINIRVLPMSMDDHEFAGKSIEGVQEDFFEKYLRFNINNVKHNFYYYKTNALRSEPDDLVLFQYNKHIIAAADYGNAMECPENWEENNENYKGYYLFRNIRTFKPISNDEFNTFLKMNSIKFLNAPHSIKQLRIDYGKLLERMEIPRNPYKKDN